jgi:hypothetical protein
MQSSEGPSPESTQFERLYAEPSLSGQRGMWLNSRERRKFRSWCNQTHGRGSFHEWLDRGLRARDDEDFRFDWIEGYFTQRKHEDTANLLNEYVRQTTASVTAPVTAATVRNLAAMLDGVRHGARIWLHVDTERQWGGVMRDLCDAEGDSTQGYWHEGDVRDKFVRISSTLEEWLPVADIAAGLADGSILIEQAAL